MNYRTVKLALIAILSFSPTALLPQQGGFGGDYVFLLQGVAENEHGGSKAGQAAMLGNFAATNDGTISGVADLNTPRGAVEKVSITGTYVQDPSGGTRVTLEGSFGVETLLITPPPAHFPGAVVNPKLFTSIAPSVVFGSGTLSGVNTTAFKFGHVIGDYATLLSGESSCEELCVREGRSAELITGTGLLTVNALETNFSATFMTTMGAHVRENVSIGGTITSDNDEFFPYGRMELTSTSPDTPGKPQKLVAYIVDSTHLAVLSLSSHRNHALVSGAGGYPGASLTSE